MGNELISLEQEIQRSFQTLTNLHQTTCSQYVQIFWQVVLNLKGQSKTPHILIGSVYDEEASLPLFTAAHDITGLHLFYTNKLIISYLFGEFSLALDCGSRGRNYLAGGAGFVSSVVFNFYDSLTLLAAYRDRPQSQDQLLQDVAENQLRLKHYADHAPMNHLHKFYLVEAERYRVLCQREEAIEHYDLAISGAKIYGYLNEEALAYELAARFYLEWGKPKIAQSYLIDAYYRYERWGAIAKIQHLERLYPQLLRPILHQETLNSRDGSSLSYTTSTSNFHSNLDLATVMEASQLLSGEIQMDSLLESLMDVVITSAGAEKAVLILAEEDHWQVVAETIARHQTVVRSIPLIECNTLPKAIINYVIHTSETLVLEDATQETSFINDPYICAHKPRSILCAPIQYQGKMIGILYLENNLVTGAFTSDRLKILNIITTQAAISLQNAQLYDRLEQKVEERTLQIQQTNQSLMDTLSALKQTQTQLIQTEKMSSLGQMVAGFAHEINNPVNFIHGNLNHADQYFQDVIGLLNCYQKHYPQPIPEIINYLEEFDIDYILEDLPKLFASMQIGTERIREIVLSLRNFSRLDESVNKTVNVHEGIESTLLLLNHRLKSGIKVVRQYQELPLIHCYAAPLNQVFMNLLSNAIDALNDYSKSSELGPDWVPTIDIATKLIDSSVIIQISDNGAGIPEEIRKQVFDPFFTTKPVGSGTGLGLSISYQIIVEKHKGKISCQSQPGKGTEFTIELPISMIRSLTL
jgi:signal transduction histidine kinase/tetratricopeptide (TPR) repeat protein